MMNRIDKTKRNPIQIKDIQIGQLIWYHGGSNDFLVEVNRIDNGKYVYCSRYVNLNTVSIDSGGGCGNSDSDYSLPNDQEIAWFHECMRQKKWIDIKDIIPQVNNTYEIF